MNTQKIFIASKLIYIQQIRALQALSESDYAVRVPAEEFAKLKNLKKHYKLPIFTEKSENEVRLPELLRINHKKPETSIGDLSKPLIFPHAITSHCRKLWKVKRSHKISFSGMISEERKAVLQSWLSLHWGIQKDLSLSRNVISRLERKLFKLNRFRIGPVYFSSSFRGREFPEKSWDESYFKIMGRSQFVLCPNGEYTWTYRFFESILCGAIPIIETPCDIYEGFRYRKFSEDPKAYEYSLEDALWNYQLVLKQITIPIDTLNAHLADLIESTHLKKG